MRFVLVGAMVVLMAWGQAAAGGPEFLPFTATGTAEPMGSLALGLPRINAAVSWDGAAFTVQLIDPVANVPLTTDTFAGHMLDAGGHVEGCKLHNGFEARSDVVPPLPDVPEIYFLVFGRQIHDPCEGTIVTEAVGIYQEVWWLAVGGDAPK